MGCVLNIKTSIGSLKLDNPVIVASGPLTSSLESIERVSKFKPGAVVTKTIAIKRAAPPKPDIYRESSFSILNCEEWSTKPPEYWFEEAIPKAKKKTKVIASVVSISGEPWETVELARKAEDAGAHAIEVTCLYDPSRLPLQVREVVKSVEIPVLTKISIPKLEDEYVLKVCRELVEAGCSAIVVSDSYGPCLRIDPYSGEPVLAKGYGRISGPAIKPFTMYFTALISSRLGAPVVSCGGISSGLDVAEAIMLGATAVELCSILLLRGIRVLEDIINEFKDFLKEKDMDLRELRGYALDKLSKGAKGGVPTPTEKCNGCGLCALVCPQEAIHIVNGRAVIDRSRCRICGLCASTCPIKAIRWV